MSAQYLVRFDDLCPTMNWDVWSEVESTLIEHDIKPLLAVVPDNHDPKLMVGKPDPQFWDKVRQWQGQGWSIALHGYQHKYVTCDSGLVGLNTRSEFAGLPYEVQEAKISTGAKIFGENGIRPDLWIAPAHSFDQMTIKALKNHGISRLSDGFFFYPHTDINDMFWVPQQLWGFRRMSFGVWTVCYHINSWVQNDLDNFRKNIKEYANHITSFHAVADRYASRRSVSWDHACSKGFLCTSKLKRGMKHLLGAFG